MSKKICVVTTTRAEYGLLRPILYRLKNDDVLDLKLVVGGTHLSEKFGKTVNEIIADGFRIDAQMNTVSDNTDSVGIYAATVSEFNKCIAAINPDAVMVLGDRFEIMAVAAVCLLRQVPLVHLCGGDVSFGAIDDCARHAITKMACLHLTGNDDMVRRIIQLGEQPNTVFNVGEPGLENIRNFRPMDINNVFEDFPLSERKYALVTYHPVTTEKGSALIQIKNLIMALRQFPDFKFIITKANCDDDGEVINEYIERECKNDANMMFVASLGIERYLSLMKSCAAVIGNSSSGIIEAPFMKIPTVNIGNRQQGRAQSPSIINSTNEKKDIEKSIREAFTADFYEKASKTKSLYGDGHTSDKTVNIIKDFILNGRLSCKKIFYDIGTDKA